VPNATALHGKREGLHIISDGALDLHSMHEPVLVAIAFVARQRRSLIFQDSPDPCPSLYARDHSSPFR
jgi:hypothetical protein